MYLLDLTLNSPAENLALDEALLDWAEHGTSADPRHECEVLRLWEPTKPFVVLGRGSHVEEEVDLKACERLGVTVFRRSSGGASVVVGPGCLMYAVVLSYGLRPELRMLDAAHRFVLERVAKAALACVGGVAPAGTSDLVLKQPPALGQAASLPGNGADSHSEYEDTPAEAGSFGYEGDLRKFSGNSLRCKRTHFLYHGTLMYDFDIRLIEACLRMPPRQPDYRGGRSHEAFLANLPTNAMELRMAIASAWQATTPLESWPRLETARLARSRYDSDTWTQRHFSA